MTKRDRNDDVDSSGDPEVADAAARAAADIAFVEALARILRDNNLAEIELTREYGDDDELQVRLTRPTMAAEVAVAYGAAPAQPPQLAPPPHVVSAPAAASDAGPAALDTPQSHPGCVSSPMVGTVYLASEPGAAPFASVGDTVKEGQTLLIIEAMKTMNQIPSPRAGTVRQVFVENAQPVEYGAPLVIIE